MPVYHVRMSFSTREHGWVEQLYRQAPSFDAALLAAQSLALARYSILGAGVILWQVRVTQPGAPRAVATVALSGTTIATPAMLAQEGAEVRLTAGQAPSHRRSYFLRGLPAGSILNPLGPSRWGPAVQTAALAWLQLLCDGLWLEKCRGYAGPRVPIVGMYPLLPPGQDYSLPDGGPPGPSPWSAAVFVQLAGPAPVPLADTVTGSPPLVRIGLARWSDLDAEAETPINGERLAIASALDTLQYMGQVPTVGEYAGGGYAQVSQATYLPIRSALLTRAGTRHCGPPTATPERLAAPPGPPIAVVVSGPGPVAAGALAAVPVASLVPGITPVAPSPPVIPVPVGPPYPPPVSQPLKTALDVLSYIYINLTFSGQGPAYTPIGVAQILNLTNTWWIGLAGFYWTENSDTACLASFTAALPAQNTYYSKIVAAIDGLVPADASLVFQGFSLGGMMAENVGHSRPYRSRVICMNTFGSPITAIHWGSVPLVRFKCAQDFVPMMTPFGFAAQLFGQAGYTIVGEDPAYPVFPDCHTKMGTNPDLVTWDNWGLIAAGRPPFILGALSRFSVPQQS